MEQVGQRAAMLCTAGSSSSTQSHASGLGMGVEVPKDLYIGPLWAIIKQEEETAAGCAVRSTQRVLGSWMGDEENDRDWAAVCPVSAASLLTSMHRACQPAAKPCIVLQPQHQLGSHAACAAVCPWLKTNLTLN